MTVQSETPTHVLSVKGDCHLTTEHSLQRNASLWWCHLKILTVGKYFCQQSAYDVAYEWHVFISTLIAFPTGGLAIIGLIIFGAEFKQRGSRIHPNGWAFYVAVLSSALLLLQGIIWTFLVLIPGLGFHYTKEETNQQNEKRVSYNKANHHPAGLFWGQGWGASAISEGRVS